MKKITDNLNNIKNISNYITTSILDYAVDNKLKHNVPEKMTAILNKFKTPLEIHPAFIHYVCHNCAHSLCKILKNPDETDTCAYVVECLECQTEETVA